jgi:hypothetical protein
MCSNFLEGEEEETTTEVADGWKLCCTVVSAIRSQVLTLLLDANSVAMECKCMYMSTSK